MVSSHDGSETLVAGHHQPSPPSAISSVGSLSNIISDDASDVSLDQDVAQALQRKLRIINGTAAQEKSAWHRWMFGSKAARRRLRYRSTHNGRRLQEEADGSNADTDKHINATGELVRPTKVLDNPGHNTNEAPSGPIVVKVRKRKATRRSRFRRASPQNGSTRQDATQDASNTVGVGAQDYGNAAPAVAQDAIVSEPDGPPFDEDRPPILRDNLARLHIPSSPTGSIASVASYVEVQETQPPRDSDQDTIIVTPTPLDRKQTRHGLLRRFSTLKGESPSSSVATKLDDGPISSSSRYDTARRDLLRTFSWTNSDVANDGKAAKPATKKRRRKHLHGSSRRDALGVAAIGADPEVEHEDVIVDALLQAGILEDETTHTLVTDMLWENQRGWWFLGSRFSSLALSPLDAKPWTNPDGSQAGYTIFTHPLPTPAWRWHHPAWLIDMGRDVDAEGWQYSTRFGSKYWRGVPTIAFTVRRRLWVRSRYRPSLTAQDSEPPLEKAAHLISPACDSDIVNLLANIPAHHLRPCNPFITWYAPFSPKSGLNALGRTILEGGLASAGSLPSAPRHKEHIVHLNFVRAAKILIRHCQVDRERVMYMQHWLGVDQTKEDGFLDSEHHDNPSSMAQPDVRDVYDLLERRLDDVLLLLEYQTSRQALLSLILDLHNTDAGHPQHRYANRSADSESRLPSELSATHKHGHATEMGGRPVDAPHPIQDLGQRVPRLAFCEDIRRRVRDFDVHSDVSPET